ncbi:branched-chain amino acid ABC transporter permease [bacterium]|nr:branched-chain amino acid ABC transporter permease [bacterium]
MDLSKYIARARPFRWPLFAALCLIPVLGGCNGAPLSLGTLLEQLFIGLILGSVYALIALGYTLVYGVIKLINFAHGDIYMLGAFFGYYLLRFFIRWLHFGGGLHLIWCFVFSTVISAVICAGIAVLMERLAYRPLRGSSRIAALITAVGVSFLLENLGIITFGPNPKSYEPKTLETYQLQIADSQDFASANAIQVLDSTQKNFPASRFSGTTYARVRMVNKHGTSEWSPVLEMLASKPGGFIEGRSAERAAETLEEEAALPPDGALLPAAPHSIGFSRRAIKGKEMVVLNWAKGRPSDIRLNSVFSDREGNTLAFELPVKSATGANVRIPVFNICIVVVTLLMLWGLNLLINRSSFGICMRALSYDMPAAKLMGVNTDLIIAQTFAIGGACAAVAGNMVGMYNQSIEPLMGILPGLKAFVAAVVGGIGSIPGAAVGGLIMGISESMVKTFIPTSISSLADALAFAILIVVLLFKPTGIFGVAVREKV